MHGCMYVCMYVCLFFCLLISGRADLIRNIAGGLKVLKGGGFGCFGKITLVNSGKPK